LADEIVDTFQDHDKKTLLERLKADTNNALKNGLSLNPILHAFQDVVARYKIPHEYIEAFLESMEMDLTLSRHGRESYDRYVYGSAEVIGLMCLKIFCRNDETLFEELQGSARLLGSAFQKVNFLRDVKADWELRGRIYLPGVFEIDKLSNEAKRATEEEIEKEFAQAFLGIKKLPRDVRVGVYSAYLYYQALLKKIKGVDIQTLLSCRVRVSNLVKLMLLLRAALEVPFLR
jgi:phytoene synthase